MNTPRLLRAKLPVTYRWLRRRRYFPYAVLLACAFIFLPFGIVSGVKLSNSIAANNAMAATRAMAPEHNVSDVLSDYERIQYAAALSGLVLDDPGTIHQLIGQDFIVMFNDPDLRRVEGESVIWQYRSASCVLDLYFEHDHDGKEGAAIHYEVRQRKIAAYGEQGQHEEKIDEQGCLSEIYSQRSI